MQSGMHEDEFIVETIGVVQSDCVSVYSDHKIITTYIIKCKYFCNKYLLTYLIIKW